jgi:hypothetical protein
MGELLKINADSAIESMLAEHGDAFNGYRMSAEGDMISATKFFNRELMTEIRPLMETLDDDLDGTGVAEIHGVDLLYGGDQLEARFAVPVDLSETYERFETTFDAEDKLRELGDRFAKSGIQLTPQNDMDMKLFAVVEDRLLKRNRTIKLEGVQVTDMANFIFTIPRNMAREYDESLIRSQHGRRDW